jgi:hypothetical protein
MAVLLKNPMPLNGALFVSNPRRRRKSNPRRRKRNPIEMRLNGPVTRTRRVIWALEANLDRGGKVADASKASAKRVQAADQWVRSDDGKDFFRGTRAGFSKAARAKAGKVVLSDEARRPKASQAKMLKVASNLSVGAKSSGETYRADGKRSLADKLVRVKPERGGNYASQSGVRRGISSGQQLDEDKKVSAKLSRPARKSKAGLKRGLDAFDDASFIESGFVANPKKKGKKRKSSQRVSAKAKRARAQAKKNMEAAWKAVDAGKYKSIKTALKAAWAGKLGTKKDVKRTAAQRKKTGSTKWTRFLKKFGGRGLSRTQLKRLYRKSADQQKVALQRLKRVRTRKGESKYAAQKRYKKRARSMVRERGKRQRMMGPYLLRVNKNKAALVNYSSIPDIGFYGKGLVSKAYGLVEKGASLVGRIPVVGNYLQFIIPVGAVAAGAVYAHNKLKPVVMPLVDEAGSYLSSTVPLMGLTPAIFNAVNKAPATITATAAYAALKVLGHYGIGERVIEPKNLNMLGGLLILSGAILDAKDYFSSSDQSGFGEAWAVGANSLNLGPLHGAHDMGAIEMAGMHMNGAHDMSGAHDMGFHHENPHCYGGDPDLNAIHSEYADAHFGDAYYCADMMHPDEISAAMAGPAFYLKKFGHSPIRQSGARRGHSRHAGKMGHRYGILIKMIGFRNFQKIAALPPHQRQQVINQLRKQAIAAVPAAIAAAQAESAGFESASLPVDGAANGAEGIAGLGYGALMFAGNGY